jgi:hypothetical protein
MLKEKILVIFLERFVIMGVSCEPLRALEQVYSPFYFKHFDYFFLSNVHMIQKII